MPGWNPCPQFMQGRPRGRSTAAQLKRCREREGRGRCGGGIAPSAAARPFFSGEKKGSSALLISNRELSGPALPPSWVHTSSWYGLKAVTQAAQQQRGTWSNPSGRRATYLHNPHLTFTLSLPHSVSTGKSPHRKAANVPPCLGAGGVAVPTPNPRCPSSIFS